jgi:hypothetical protein
VKYEMFIDEAADVAYIFDTSEDQVVFRGFIAEARMHLIDLLKVPVILIDAPDLSWRGGNDDITREWLQRYELAADAHLEAAYEDAQNGGE